MKTEVIHPLKIRLLFHLKQFNSEKYTFDGPVELTQDGIAQALGISRAHASITIKRANDKGWIETRLLHIDGHKRRVRAYVLNPTGYLAVKELGVNI